MTPQRWSRMKEIFAAAREKKETDRAAYLDSACGEDGDLRAEVVCLLAKDEGPSLRSPAADFLESLAPEFAPGEMVARYRVEAELGRGGMGVVYRAFDSQLRRPVALKVLPPEYAADPERRSRLLREARAASGLSHPNIVGIYEVGSDKGVDFIAMEFVEGDTLAALIPAKGLPLAKALDYAVQIAGGLAKAHRAGVIHRDLKPGNMIVTPDGLVKLVDFGLARRVELEPGQETTLTREGDIVGTPAYMSPEQAEGKALDPRSDVFSFGVVLYQMLSGRRPFQGNTPASTIAAILKEDPKPTGQIVEGVPAELDRIVRRCLRKDPAQRVQHMDDLKVALEELKQESDSGVLGVVSGQTKQRKRRPKLVWAFVATLLAFVAAGVWFARFRSSPEPELVPVPLTSYPGIENNPSFSPDGTEVAFTWCKDSEPERCNIYVKEIGVEPPSQLTDASARDCCPAWSPDGRSIAFVRRLPPAQFSIIIIPKRGGRERVLSEFDGSEVHPLVVPTSGAGTALSWTPDSKWLAVPDTESSVKNVLFLSLLSVKTGEKRRLTRPPVIDFGEGDGAPAFSPDGRTLLFCRYRTNTDIYLLHLGDGYTPEGEPVALRSGYTPTWLPDGREIIFSSGTGLWRTTLSKSAAIRKLPFAAAGVFAVSRQLNRLAFAVRRFDTNIWRIRLGDPARKLSPERFISSTRGESFPAYSPDGKRIAFVSDRSGTIEIWLCDSDGSHPSQLTSLGAYIMGPQWSPDSRKIVFWVPETGHNDVYEVDAGGGAPKRLEASPQGGTWPSWSRDGKSLYFSAQLSHQGMWKMFSTGGHAMRLTRGEDYLPQESPEGGFVYYETGWPSPMTVWKMPAQGGEPTKILEGVDPRGQFTLSKKGIFYPKAAAAAGRTDIRLYDFATGKDTKVITVDRGVPERIAVSPDGLTLLYTQADEAGSDLMLVENFR